MKFPVIALLTDFGDENYFVSSMKAVIVNINPLARIIDITHKIPSYDIYSGSFNIFAVYRYFPSKTIFLIVVDPEVGSSRKILLAEAGDYYFIAPDNGILSLVLQREKKRRIRAIKNDKFFLHEAGRTFDGRDRMAPVAAWLSNGVSCGEFGPEIKSYKKIDIKPHSIKDNEIIGRVLYIDKFGNLITDIPSEMVASKADIVIAGKIISNFEKNYVSAKKGEIFFLKGSLGFIEIALKEDSVSDKLKVRVRDEVKVRIRR